MASFSTTRTPAGLGKQIGAAGEGALDMHARPGDRLAISAAATSRGDILRSSRAATIGVPAALPAPNLDRTDQLPFLSHQRTLADGGTAVAAERYLGGKPHRTS